MSGTGPIGTIEPSVGRLTIDGIHYEPLEYGQLTVARPHLLRFCRSHGKRRITGKALRWLQTYGRKSSAEVPPEPGTMILIAHRSGQLLGVLGTSNFGADVMMIVVRRRLRGQKIGRRLVGMALARAGKLYARVASDNTASIAMCFAAGLSAISLEKGVTGKPTLLFAAGHH